MNLHEWSANLAAKNHCGANTQLGNINFLFSVKKFKTSPIQTDWR